MLSVIKFSDLVLNRNKSHLILITIPVGTCVYKNIIGKLDYKLPSFPQPLVKNYEKFYAN